ncbi:hypothetical protein [Rhodovulum sp. P5]|uniref:hypothetical protein n=1 Tax=Rhodovulum sp. P5 TaxID=1564506 RepID=UPI0009DA6C56|nr:hypothetical protein [Rhodovulum sp. P5]
MHETLSSKLADFGWEVLCMPTSPDKDLKILLRNRAEQIIEESTQVVSDVSGNFQEQNVLPANSTLRRLVRNGKASTLGPFSDAVKPFHEEATDLLTDFIKEDLSSDKPERSKLMGALSRYSEFLSEYRI